MLQSKNSDKLTNQTEQELDNIYGTEQYEKIMIVLGGQNQDQGNQGSNFVLEANLIIHKKISKKQLKKEVRNRMKKFYNGQIWKQQNRKYQIKVNVFYRKAEDSQLEDKFNKLKI